MAAENIASSTICTIRLPTFFAFLRYQAKILVIRKR